MIKKQKKAFVLRHATSHNDSFDEESIIQSKKIAKKILKELGGKNKKLKVSIITSDTRRAYYTGVHIALTLGLTESVVKKESSFHPDKDNGLIIAPKIKKFFTDKKTTLQALIFIAHGDDVYTAKKLGFNEYENNICENTEGALITPNSCTLFKRD